MLTSITTLFVIGSIILIALILHSAEDKESAKERWKQDFITHLSSIHCDGMSYEYIKTVANEQAEYWWRLGKCPIEAAEGELQLFKLARGILE